MEPRIKRGLIVGLILLLVVVAGVIGIYYFGNRGENKGNDDNEKDKITKEYKYSLTIYRDEEGNVCLDKSVHCKNEYLTIKVESENARFIDLADNLKYVLIDDNGLQLYNLEDETRDKIDLNGYEQYALMSEENSDDLFGIAFYKDRFINSVEREDYKISGFYNIEKKKKIFEGEYRDLRLLNKKYLVAFSEEDAEEDGEVTNYLLSTEEEKVVKSVKAMCMDYSTLKVKDGSYILERSGCVGVASVTVYTEDMKQISESVPEYFVSSDDEGNVNIVKDNQVVKYNLRGEKVGTSNHYTNILQVAKGYIIYLENNKLKITDDKDIDVEVVEWNQEYSYDGGSSGYRGEDFEGDNNEIGIYMNYYTDDGFASYRFDLESKKVFIVNEK